MKAGKRRKFSDKDITGALAKLPRSKWNTSDVSRVLQRLAYEKKCDLYRRGNKNKEFLVDYVLYSKPKPNRIELAVESCFSESNCKGVVHDFDKLMHIKAPMKLVITTVSEIVWEETKNKIEEYLSNFGHHIGERYLIAHYPRKRGNVRFWICTVGEANNGRCSYRLSRVQL